MMASKQVVLGMVLSGLGAGCAPDRRPFQADLSRAETASEGLRREIAAASASTGGAARAEDATAHPSSGWLDREDSPLYPWCGAVLVAEDLAVTSASCVALAGALRFGLGVPGQSPGVPIADVQRVASDPRLAWLALETPVASAKPAVPRLDGGRDAAEELAVVGVSMLFAPRGEASARWTWRGTLRSAMGELLLEPSPDAPADRGNCHGDNGSGVFDADGRLVGVVVAAGGASRCVEWLRLAPLPSLP